MRSAASPISGDEDIVNEFDWASRELLFEGPWNWSRRHEFDSDGDANERDARLLLHTGSGVREALHGDGRCAEPQPRLADSSAAGAAEGWQVMK